MNKSDTIYNKYIKRTLDITFSIILIILLIPLLFIIYILLLVVLKDEVIFKQSRIGLNNQRFIIYKFRTINNNKITKTGRILRKTSLDELPQLFNILKGDMSFVGPRPITINEKHLLDEKTKTRHEVKPGLTGLSQVNGRRTLSYEQRFYFDIIYVSKISFILDLKIILKTFIVIFKFKENN